MRIFKMCTLKTLYSAAAFKLLLHFAKCKMVQSHIPDSESFAVFLKICPFLPELSQLWLYPGMLDLCSPCSGKFWPCQFCTCPPIQHTSPHPYCSSQWSWSIHVALFHAYRQTQMFLTSQLIWFWGWRLTLITETVLCVISCCLCVKLIMFHS